MTEAVDLEEILARLPKRTAAEDFAEIEKARQALRDAPPPEPTIIPMPEFGPKFSGLVRYSCGLACGWAYDMNTMAWEIGPISFRADDPDGLSKALTAQAEQRAAEMRERIEDAIRAHFAEAHPGLEIPTQGER